MTNILPQLLLGLILAVASTAFVRQWLPRKSHFLVVGSIMLPLFLMSIFFFNHILFKTKIEIPYIKIGAVKSIEATEPPITACLKNLEEKGVVLKTPKPCSIVKSNNLTLFEWVEVPDKKDLLYSLNISECLYQAPTTTTKENSLKITVVSDKERRCNWWVTSFYPNGSPGPSSQQNQFFIK